MIYECSHCGSLHHGSRVCPRIKRITYHPDGTVASVEYFSTAPDPYALVPAFVWTPPPPPPAPAGAGDIAPDTGAQ